MEEDIEKLLEKYYEGETSVEEEKELKKFFQREDVPEHLQSHAAQFVYFVEAKKELPSLTFNSDLALMLDPPQKGPVRRLTSWIVRIAAGLTLLLVGFGAGWLFQSRSDAKQGLLAKSDNVPVSEMKTVLAFEKMGETSASERIQAVNQSLTLPEVDQEVTQLLINTLNFDPNINVRIAACQALMHFENETGVSEALIRSLSIQTDPNIQISLIEALVAIKEKRAVDPLRQFVKNKEVLEPVRARAEAGLTALNAADV
jgi:hypothetical protein